MLDFVAGQEEGKSQENPLNTGRHDASFCLGLNSDCDATTMQIMQNVHTGSDEENRDEAESMSSLVRTKA